MSTYYCSDCAKRLSIVSPIPLVSGAGPSSGYLQDKFFEHTVSGTTGKLKSIFDDGSWPTYQGRIQDTINSGAVEIDHLSRVNFIACIGTEIGQTFQSGQLVERCHSVKVVLSHLSGKQHAYPIAFPSGSQACAGCGKPIS